MYHFGIHFLICNVLICLFIGIIITFKRLLRNHLSARMQYNLWFILLVILAIPFLPIRSLPVTSFLSWFNFQWGTQAENTTTDISCTTPTASDSAFSKVNDFAVSVSNQTPAYVNIFLLVIWEIGIFLMILLICRSLKRLRTIEQSALPLQNKQVKVIFQNCIAESGIKKEIPVYSTAFLKSPVTVGFIKPHIYIPIHLISDLHQADMRFMILHELQHYRYKDALIGHIMNLIGILYWFNPLIWYSLKEMRCDREIACDCSVLQLLNETDYEAYGNTLINFAEKISLSPFPFATGISGSMKQMKKRILSIANFKKQPLTQKIQGIIAFVFVACLLLGCAPVLSIHASGYDQYTFNEDEKNITYIDLTRNFDGYEGCFVLYDSNAGSWNIYNMDSAQKRIAPNSTYKIYDALLGLENDIITPQHSNMVWNGEDYPFYAWEADQNLNSAMQNSVNWYFQSIDSQIGLDSVKKYLHEIGYGNQTAGTDTDLYWTDDSLKISALEQIKMLEKFHDNEFDFSPENIAAVKNSILLISNNEGSFYGKTGTGRVDGQDVNGWFIGFLEKSGNIYYFATNIQGESETTGGKAAEITTSVLSDLQIWN